MAKAAAGHRVELPGHRVRRRAESNPPAHRRLRRLRRANGPGEARIGHKLLQFPTVMGSVVVIINVPGIEDQPAQADGRAAGRHLRRQDHQVERPEGDRGQSRRHVAEPRDRTGVSCGRLRYDLCVYVVPLRGQPDWKEKVGASTSVKWPAGAGAKGNDGVAATVRNTRGGIGYVEYAYASQNHLVTVQLRNKAGNFVAPRWRRSKPRRRVAIGRRKELRGQPDSISRAKRAGLSSRPPSSCCRRIPRSGADPPR